MRPTSYASKAFVVFLCFLVWALVFDTILDTRLLQTLDMWAWGLGLVPDVLVMRLADAAAARKHATLTIAMVAGNREVVHSWPQGRGHSDQHNAHNSISRVAHRCSGGVPLLWIHTPALPPSQSAGTPFFGRITQSSMVELIGLCFYPLFR